MNIRVFDTYAEMSRAAANLVAAQLVLKPDSHIGLTAGKSPMGMFQELVKIHQERSVSFSDAWYYNLEEIIGYGQDSPESYCAVFYDLLLNHVAAPSRMRLPNGLAADIEAECANYDALLESLPGGGLDLQVLGIGVDGHIGCNRPGDTLLSKTHPVSLSRGRTGMATGMRGILGAKCLLMLASGEDKAQAIADLCHAEISTHCPSTLLQLHPNVIVLLDRAAAAGLSLK